MSRSGGAWREGRATWERLRGWLTGAPSSDDGEALDALSDVAAMRYLLDGVELAAVRAARQRGASWAEIATRLGVTRQSAWERWRDLEPTTDQQTVREVEAAAAAELVLRTAGQRRRRSTVTVPAVVGLPFDDAHRALTHSGLVAVRPDADGPGSRARGWPDGVVRDQAPEAGAKVPAGSAVTLWSGRGGGSAGVREPRRPSPGPRTLRATRDEPRDEAVG